MQPKVIIFDFDGVICDSVNVKTEAFIELYKDSGPEIQSLVKQYHIRNGGISRFEKIKYFQTSLLGLPESQLEVEVLANRFATLVKNKVVKSPYLPGVLRFLQNNSECRLQFICTGTPEYEILEIVEKRNIKELFSGIYGSPKTKVDIITNILQDTKSKPSDCVFFGDAMTDYKAAEDCKVPFVGIRNEDTVFPEGTFVIDNFEDPKIKQLFI